MLQSEPVLLLQQELHVAWRHDDKSPPNRCNYSSSDSFTDMYMLYPTRHAICFYVSREGVSRVPRFLPTAMTLVLRTDAYRYTINVYVHTNSISWVQF